MNIYPVYISKYNLNDKNHIIRLMITNGEEWHHLAVKRVISTKMNNVKTSW